MIKQLILCLIIALYSNMAFAQTDSAPAPDLRPKSATTSGFSIRYDGLFEPNITETSNGTIYGLILRRNAIASGIYTPDVVMPLARLTQTFLPLAEVGTEAQLLDATTGDALNSVKELLNDTEFEFPESTECTRTIAGKVRTGVRYQIMNYIDGRNGFVECFVFEDDSGKGVGAILKYRDGVDDATGIDDSLLLNDILDDLQIIPLSDSSKYTYRLAQYPIHLPVLSQVVDVKQLSEYAVEMKVQMQGASLTLQLINVPQDYSVQATRTQQLDDYKKMIHEQEKQSVISQNWSAVTHLATGNDLSDLVEGHVYTYTGNNQNFYNTLYTQVNGNLIVSANFTTTKEQYRQVHQYAKTLFKDSVGASISDRTEYTFPGFELDLPRGYNLYRPNGSTRYDEYLITNQSIYQFEEKLNRVYSRIPMTQFKFSALGEFESLTQTHHDLLNDLMNRVKPSDKPTEYHTDEQLSVSNFTLPNGTLMQKINSVIYPQINTDLLRFIGFDDSALSVTSYLIPNPNTGTMCVASSISNLLLSPSADDTTIALLNSINPTTSMTEKDLGFATLSFDPFESKFYRYNETSDDGYTYFLLNDHERITITVSQSDSRNEVKSARLLAEKHMKAAWRFQTTGDIEDLFPSDMKKLVDVQIAGRDGVYFEQSFTPEFDWTDSPEPEKNYIRLYGFVHNDRFISVTLVQKGDSIDPDRLDRWLEAFSD